VALSVCRACLEKAKLCALFADELAAWQNPEQTWDMAMFGLRVEPNPQAMTATTSRPIPIIQSDSRGERGKQRVS
jgi:phage terminase large subunit-like protein